MSRGTASVVRRRLLRAFVACVVLLAVAGYVAVHLLVSGPGSPRCVVRAEGRPGEPRETYHLEPQQAVNAATIAVVGSARGLPERAVTIALATAMQESGLRNIGYGDRDSLGLFQQRPSQGWGTAEQIMDPVYSAGAFYDHLEKVPGYSRMPLTVAAQEVQRSGFPEAYAKHEPNAALLGTALTGRSEASLSCYPGAQEQAGDPAEVREKLRREFGPDVLADGPGRGGAAGREAPEGGAAGQAGGASGEAGAAGATGAPPAAGKSAATGPVIRVPVPESAAGGERRGWELAHWAVAHSRELRIARVSFAGRAWSSASSSWHPERSGSAADGERAAGEVVITTVQ
ncbi:hypothetical protein HCK00_10730 [Streptomyces sp. PLAI1-29]|uniref:Heavy metal transporter n=1 Tax=Streptomyces zingiberis TaxID=2053010 RepID=A0ABX1BTF1_9ACTN|nr:hypothetical protein [Streptomyces zingiberis]NJQ00991.1 hypothetical protein [Streptomyces zingiberis]